MATRPIFVSDTSKRELVSVVDTEFDWYPGFSVKQKQRSIESLHAQFSQKYGDCKILEISSKSTDTLGVNLSAFNLMIHTKNNKSFSVETAFQSSKVFENGGPFVDLLQGSSRDAKKDQRLKTSGKLLYFRYFNREWPLKPKTLFYDWLYMNALALNKDMSKEILEFEAFSDIEFNPDKSINCQARSAALYVSLYKLNLLENVLSSTENYIEFLGGKDFKNTKNKGKNEFHEQLSIFDLDK